MRLCAGWGVTGGECVSVSCLVGHSLSGDFTSAKVPAAALPQAEGDLAAGSLSLSFLTLMWGWDWPPAQWQEARGQAHSKGLG